MKKTLIVLIILILAGGIVTLGIWFRSRNEIATPEEIAGNGLPINTATPDIPRAELSSDTQNLPSGGSNRFGVVSQREVLDYTLDARNHVFIAARDGNIIEIADNKENVIYEASAPVPLSASFSYDGKKVLSSFGDPARPRWSVFDITAGSWEPLSEEIMHPVWSPNDYRIAYLARQGTRFALSVLDLGNRTPRPQAIFSFSTSHLDLSWNTPGYILLSELPTGFAPSSIWKLDVQKKTLEPLILDQLGANVTWGKTAERGLAFISLGKGSGGTLALVDGKGETEQTLNIQTLPEKCTLYRHTKEKEIGETAELIVCAVPRETDEFSRLTLPDDYYQKVFFTSDNIHAIDLKTGTLSPIFEDASFAIDAHKLKTFGAIVFFINRKDMRLYAVSLDAILQQ